MADERETGNGNGLRSTIMGWLWVVLMAAVGWIATDAATARAEMAKQINESQQRIAILEEANRNSREALSRIEATVEDIRRQITGRSR